MSIFTCSTCLFFLIYINSSILLVPITHWLLKNVKTICRSPTVQHYRLHGGLAFLRILSILMDQGSSFQISFAVPSYYYSCIISLIIWCCNFSDCQHIICRCTCWHWVLLRDKWCSLPYLRYEIGISNLRFSFEG